MTIGERAKEAIDEWVESGGLLKVFVSKALLDQDRISRAEERERCIKAALKACCKSCRYTCFKNSCKCATYNNIRKAIEEGGNNGND